jgi:probable HAF family extracellular repeat protein
VTAADDSPKKKPPAPDTYTITQLDIGANVASTGQLISDNQVVAGNLQGGSQFAFAWSAQSGFVVLTLGGSSSLASDISANGIVSGAADTPDGSEVLGFIWTPANGLVTIGNLGGVYTVPQSVNSSGLVIGDSTTADGRDHAFMWTGAGGMVDLDPTGLVDSAARFVTEDGGLIIGSIYAAAGQRVFAWTTTTGLVDIGTLGRDMLPEHMNRQGALTGTVGGRHRGNLFLVADQWPRGHRFPGRRRDQAHGDQRFRHDCRLRHDRRRRDARVRVVEDGRTGRHRHAGGRFQLGV